MRCYLFIIKLLVMVLLTLMAGCGTPSPPVVYHTLVHPGEEIVPLAGHEKLTGMTIGVGPVAIPDLYNRPQIPIPMTGQELQLDEFNHWAGILDREIGRALTLRISQLLSSQRVITYPWVISLEPDMQVALDILRLDLDDAGVARLEARWSMTSKDKGNVLVDGARLTQQATDGSRQGQIDAFRELVGRLGDTLASRLIQLSKN